MSAKATDLVKALGANDPDYIVSESDMGQYSSAKTAIADKMTTLVKGAGYAITDKPTSFGTMGGNAPLTDPDKVFSRAMRAEKAWTSAIKQSHENPDAVYKSLSPQFAQQFGAFLAANPQNMAMNQMVANLQQQVSDAIGKNITLTSPLSTGLVPYNLVAPSRLIYPVYSPFRNKIPRVAGQGTSFRAKIVTGVSGSQTGSSGGAFADIAIPELVSSGNPNNWPLNLPASGNQDSVDINVP